MKSKKYFYLSALSLALSALLCGLPLTALGANGSETDGKDKSGTTAVALEDNSGKMKKLGKYGLPEDSLYFKNEVMPDTWVFTDGLGRKALTNADVGAPRSDREVVIFYSDWHDNFSKNCRPFNVQQFLDNEAKRGVNLPDIINDYRYSGWPTGSVQHFWSTPVYGYYSTADEWVLRRQAELLANAGIDAISTDNTNGTYTWKSSYDAIFETWSKAMDDGVAAPKVSFMLPFASGHDTNEQLKSLYFDIYSTGKYRDLWYMRDGQPLIMAHPEGLAVSSDYLQSQIMSFFNFRYNYPGYINSNPAVKNWGWLSVYPQAVYYASNEDRQNGIIEQITVGAAENHDYVRHELPAMNGKNVTARTWTSLGYDPRPDAQPPGA
ncbi:MAG: hypothetical protein MJ137_09445, partial [Clostridia bacterium]|nr:hypothetical protein [Clostridia bacterium]